MTVKAIWNDGVLAQSDDTVIVEGNHYFPARDVVAEALLPSEHTTFCPWKGTAHYYSVTLGGAVNSNAAWYYPEPFEKAAEIKGRIAFWNGVKVLEE